MRVVRDRHSSVRVVSIDALCQNAVRIQSLPGLVSAFVAFYGCLDRVLSEQLH